MEQNFAQSFFELEGHFSEQLGSPPWLQNINACIPLNRTRTRVYSCTRNERSEVKKKADLESLMLFEVGIFSKSVERGKKVRFCTINTKMSYLRWMGSGVYFEPWII